ncbi:MAG: short chain dehydrogenase [Gammaproteobacteria bacterium]|nr:short chain dehydrogenase [Gammaproteobacteria bacterium]MYD76584.1 short chain dehydrogenase [Gammaproteobacteria bacterium]MYJ51778.1 short chain dehydrogenase [Gammaproteobacteria bacterium]
MRVVVIGASGSVGSTVVEAIKGRHELIRAGLRSGDIQVDVEKIDSIRAMYERVGRIDAMVVAVGHGHFGPAHEMTGELWMKGILHKALPQINVVLEGISCINDRGSFTLTSGILNRDPIAGCASAASANGAIDGFVLGAAADMPRGIRINAVSPGLLENSVDRYEGKFPGHEPVSSRRVGLAYCKSIEGVLTGKTIIVD